MVAYLNACAFKPVAYSDADDFVVNGSAPVLGHYAPAVCANPTVQDAATYHYFAISDDRTQYEEGDAEWDSDTETLQRQGGSVRNSSNSGSLVNFSATPTVYMGGPAASDWPVVAEVQAGDRVTVDNTDPTRPIVSAASTHIDVTATGTGPGVFNVPSLDGINSVNLISNGEGEQHVVNFTGDRYSNQPVRFELEQTAPGDLAFISSIRVAEQGGLYLGLYAGSPATLLWQENISAWVVVDAPDEVIQDDPDVPTMYFGHVGLGRTPYTLTYNQTSIVAYTPIVKMMNDTGSPLTNVDFSIHNSLSFVFVEKASGSGDIEFNPSPFQMLDGSTPSAIALGSIATTLGPDGGYLITGYSSGAVTP